MNFYLGTHMPNWLATIPVPLFVSHRRLVDRRTFPRAIAPWALDSGAFSEVATNGRFTTTPPLYAQAVRRYQDEIGLLEWCAPQDWMCEPFVLAKTGYTVADHQQMTVHSYLDLAEMGVPVIPVLQGWRLDDYRHHVDVYAHNGVDLTTCPVVGVGSVCRRQATGAIENLLTSLASDGLRLHGFGVKTDGLARYGHCLTSADSLAWSYAARRRAPLPDCSHGVDGTGKCSSCSTWALGWRDRVLSRAGSPRQLTIPGTARE